MGRVNAQENEPTAMTAPAPARCAACGAPSVGALYLTLDAAAKGDASRALALCRADGVRFALSACRPAATT